MNVPSRIRQTIWFVALYFLGVGAVLIVAGVLRLMMPR